MSETDNFCTNIISAEVINIFQYTARIYIAGYSNSGKTHLCLSLLKKYISKFEKIIICDSPNNIEFQNEAKLKSKLEILDYIPTISEISLNYQNKPVILIFDDNYFSTLNSKNVLDLTTRGRHKNINLIILTQNLLSKAKFQRDITLNMTHFLITRVRDLSQLQVLSRQIFGKEYFNKISVVYQFIHKHEKWGHLLIDLSAGNTSATEMRSNIIADNKNHNYEMCYNFVK